jgi:hypothetical protein
MPASFEDQIVQGVLNIRKLLQGNDDGLISSIAVSIKNNTADSGNIKNPLCIITALVILDF